MGHPSKVPLGARSHGACRQAGCSTQQLRATRAALASQGRRPGEQGDSGQARGTEQVVLLGEAAEMAPAGEQ